MQEEEGTGMTFFPSPKEQSVPILVLHPLCAKSIYASFRMSNRNFQEHLNIQTFACVQIVNCLFKRSYICHYLRLNQIAEQSNLLQT